MPSWNIHTAHVERLLADCRQEDTGIQDANAFLFGNYAPDVYVGFMVPDTTFRIGYCITHFADPHVIPVPDADQFWDVYVVRYEIPDPALLSLTLGYWAHLVADRFYNGLFRAFCENHDVPKGEKLRTCKQADFDAFGRSLALKTRVQVTPELEEVAQSFRPYSFLPADIARSVEVANAIVSASGAAVGEGDFQLLGSAWMNATFAACDERLKVWLETWRALHAAGRPCASRDIREEAGFSGL